MSEPTIPPTTPPAVPSRGVPSAPTPTDPPDGPRTLALTPRETAMLAIDAKHAALRNAGLDLGTSTGPTIDAGYGGFFRPFVHGRIYHHPTTGAHEVHGGVLSRYLEYGGHDQHPGTLRREFGFPVTDEILTADSRRVHSVFEWGAIYWINGGVGVFGPIWQAWKAQSAEVGPLGYPVTTRVPADGLDVVHFEGGCIVAGGPLSAPVIGRTDGPMIGRPAIVKPSDDRVPLAIEFEFAPDDWDRFGDPQRLVALLRDRYVLQSVSRATPAVPLVPELGGVRTVLRPPSPPRVAVRVTFRTRPGTRTTDRTLYNLGVQAPDGGTYVARPHAFYAKESWSAFGVVHATDIHVSRRVDGFRAALERAGRLESAGLFVNPNNALRDLVRHLNRLHAAGEVDVVMATGDLVDYAYEAGDDRDGGGNFAMFEDILLGRSPYPDRPGTAVEELRVPVFTSLGNHDYRPEPYPLRFELEVPGWFNRYMNNYRSFNLTQGDAVDIQGGTPSVSTDAARRMVHPTRPGYYFRRINPTPSYVVPLGAHRLVMLDTGPDVGLLDSDADALAAVLGWHTEDEGQFASGSPNSEGVSAQEITLLRAALGEAAAGGLVLVGMHAPPLNPKGDEYPYYFRETARVSSQQDDQVVGFLARRDYRVAYDQPADIKTWRARAKQFHPEWFTAGEHFKRRRQGDLLDSGVSRGETQTFLEICAGSEGRPVDLVLFGHVHRHVEYRLSWDAGAGEVRYHTDFYSESPRTYYTTSVLTSAGGQGLVHERRLVDVFPDAPPQGGPSRVRDHRGPWAQEPRLEVATYARPLAEAPDPRGWWAIHRPLLMQTAPLGPTESNDRRVLETNPHRPGPSFRGARLISVRDGVVVRIAGLSAATIASGAGAAAVG